MARFLAIDFETADHGSDSACAVGLVRVEDGVTTASQSRLIRPPRRRILFTAIHGIAWRHVAAEPDFAGVWNDLAHLAEGVDYLVAHNAGFDRRVLRACCAAAGVAAPEVPWICTVRLARAAWGVFPTKLPNVCDYLGIALRHHDAGSDALACATIAARALAQGHRLDLGLIRG